MSCNYLSVKHLDNLSDFVLDYNELHTFYFVQVQDQDPHTVSNEVSCGKNCLNQGTLDVTSKQCSNSDGVTWEHIHRVQQAL